MNTKNIRVKRRNEFIAYAPTALVLATLPHRSVNGSEFVRRNGNHYLSILAPSKVGIPFGVLPRLILIWIATQVVVTKSRDIYLGRSCRQFMAGLELASTGGKSGSIGRLRRQMASLFQCSISFYEQATYHDVEVGMRLTDLSSLWWTSQGDMDFEGGYIRISEQFFNEIIRSAFPIDTRAVKKLKQSPLALDIYMWLTYRVYRLKAPCFISWEDLNLQFGSGYTYLWHFEAAFVRCLIRVKEVYPEIEAYCVKGKGLRIYPSKTHISPACG